MNTSIRALATTAAFVAAFGLAAPARAQAEDPSGYGDGYQAGDYGRIRSAEAGATVVRANGETDARDRAGVNAPIFPGDTVRTDGAQRVEVQLANGTLVRIDRTSDVVFQSLPNPSAKFQDNGVLTLSGGALRVTSSLGDKEEFRIDTRDASVYLLGNGEFRIDADPRGGTRVSSLRGVAEVVGNDSSVLVRGGTRTAVGAGNAPENPRAYTAFASDGFDRWCAARDDSYRTHDAYAAGGAVDQEDVPAEVRPYYGELSASGTWITTAEYGTVWSPGGVAAGWRPYSDGYWAYGPGGYFWVSYEPWGWAPYHYGNWQWIGAYGWCWMPGSFFAGAWVSWSWGSLYLGWAPLDYWGRPGWTGGPYYYGYYDPGCWTFVDYDHAGSTNVHRYAVPVGTVGDDLRHATVVSRAPRVDPRHVGGGSGARERALRDVSTDGPAHMRPLTAKGTPSRTLSDIQTQMTKRPARATANPRGWNAAGGDAARPGNVPAKTGAASARAPRNASGATGSGGNRETAIGRERRILEDPRHADRLQLQRSTGGGTRPDSRDGVRDLYQRMSRPRETREQVATPSEPRRSGTLQLPERSRRSADAQRSRVFDQLQRSQPRADTPRAQAPQRVSPQRASPQRASPQRASPQRANPQSSPRQQARPAAPQGQPKQGDKKR